MFVLRLLNTTLLAALAAGSLAFAAPVALAGEPVHQVRSVDGAFDRLTISGSIDVTLVQGPVASVTVDAAPDLAASIHSRVEDGTLKIDSTGVHVIEFGGSGHSHTVVTVTVPNLKEININGSSDLYAASFSSSDDLSLRLRSSGDVHIDHLAVRKLSTAIQGSADVDLAGTVGEQSISIQGSGDYRAEHLKSASASVSIQGSGDASVWVEQALAIQIAGSGDVDYWGKPSVSQTVAGSGDVVARGERH